MNTVTLLESRSSEMSEGLYLELMNNLKIDFDSGSKKTIVVIQKGIPEWIICTKQKLRCSIK